MNPELREMLGIVAYQAAIKGDGIGRESWDELSEHVKELYRTVGEAVAMELATVALPALQGIVFAFTGKQVDMHLK